jgi:hypothetical protein
MHWRLGPAFASELAKALERCVMIESAPRQSQPHITDGKTYSEALALVEVHGDDAPVEADSRAQEARDKGNLKAFAYWRGVEQATQIVLLEEVIGEIH